MFFVSAPEKGAVMSLVLQESASSHSPLFCPSPHHLSRPGASSLNSHPWGWGLSEEVCITICSNCSSWSWCIFFPYLILLQNQPFYLSLWCVKSSRTMTSSCWFRTIHHVGVLWGRVWSSSEASGLDHCQPKCGLVSSGSLSERQKPRPHSRTIEPEFAC